jgi:phosphatidylserine decarboxylase
LLVCLAVLLVSFVLDLHLLRYVASVASVTSAAGLLLIQIVATAFSIHVARRWVFVPRSRTTNTSDLQSLVMVRRRESSSASSPSPPHQPSLSSTADPSQVLTAVAASASSKPHRRFAPPQVVRWDFVGVFMSSAFGMVGSITLPTVLRTPLYKLWAVVFRANLAEITVPLREFRSLQEFFGRPLRAGVRPVADSPLVSPSDGKIIVVGVVSGDRVEQVKGVTYSLTQFLGQDSATLLGSSQYDDDDDDDDDDGDDGVDNGDVMNDMSGCEEEEEDDDDDDDHGNEAGDQQHIDSGDVATATTTTTTTPPSRRGKVSRAIVSDVDSQVDVVIDTDAAVGEPSAERDTPPSPSPSTIRTTKTCLYHAVIYLAPGDYHRFHAPANFTVKHLRHFPGTLFPISPIVARLIPNLFALNERVVLTGTWEYGFFSMTAVGAYNVGSIAMNFESRLKTNKLRRDYKCPNLELFR